MHKRNAENKRYDEVEKLSVIEMHRPQAMALRGGKLAPRHGVLSNGLARAYKGYKGDSNYCMEITRDEQGKWQGRVVSTFEANVDARNRDKEESFSYTSKTAGSLYKAKGRLVTISPIGEVRDPGFKP